jgi:hypothetical protein
MWALDINTEFKTHKLTYFWKLTLVYLELRKMFGSETAKTIER